MLNFVIDYSAYRSNHAGMDKLKAIQIFVSIADSGSLTAAANELRCSLPAVVRTLAALESELGARLFNRTTRRIALTDEGRQYLAHCRQLLSALNEAEAELRAEHSEPQGRLVVTAPVLFGQLHVCGAITRFAQRYPGVNVEVHLLDSVVDLIAEGFDVGIRIGELEDSTLVARKVGQLRRIVVATPDYLDRYGEPHHPQELLQHNCLKFTGASALMWDFFEGKKRFNVQVRGNFSCNQVAPVVDACLDGMGFGMFISYQVAPHVLSGTLRIVLADYEPPPRPINVLYPQSRLLPARTRVFVDALCESLRDQYAIWQAEMRVSAESPRIP